MKRMPLWFRIAFGASFALMLVPFVVLKTGVGQEAIAYGVANLFESGRLAPLLATDAALPGRFELPADGSYVMNGMPVEYHTYPVRESAASLTRQFQGSFERAGYKHKVVDVEGAPTLVAVHPETKMMLTVRLVRDRMGKPGVRLTQQDLSKLQAGTDVELPRVPTYPRAGQRVHISALEDRPSQSLSYLASGSVGMVEQFYRDEMKAEGWRRLDPPVRLPEGSPVPLFFERNGLESSILVVPLEGSSGTFVMVTLTGEEREDS
jgi:hypothetical protein